MFNLSRYFSTISLALIALAGASLGLFYEHLAQRQLLDMAQERNVAMAHVFRNVLWPRHGTYLTHAPTRDPAGLRAWPVLQELHDSTQALMRGTEAVKAKFYDLQGLTVYSTDLRQIGEPKHDNPGVRAALAGRTVSELAHRDHIDSFEGTLSDRDVIFSYIPIAGPEGEVLSVFELYQDVTPFLNGVRRTRWWIAGGVLGVLALLYVAQFAVVRRAHRILHRQERQLHQANRLLDARVQERTQALTDANQRLSSEIQERRAAEAQLAFRTHHDALTGLPNWLQFNQELAQHLAHAARHGERLGVLLIDLDNFRNVNDSLGHAVGDALLCAVAQRLGGALRAEDTLARLSGDEFVCMVEALRRPIDAAEVARKLLQQFEAPFLVDGNELLVSASIGVSVFPDDGDSAELLVRNADTAMNRAKESGHHSVQFYAPGMTQDASERLRMHRLLGGALARRELSLVYQPQVNSVTGELVGAEALLRWHSPELGEVPPSRFVPLAEDTGQIVALGEWVLQTACEQWAQWRHQGLAPPRLCVNLSVRQLERADVPALVERVLAGTGLAPDQLELEITESTLMAIEGNLGVLTRLRAMGVKLAVDDFGTGYSSLAYLKRLPIDKLKIDRAFVTGIGQGGGDEAIIEAIVALARSLGLEVLAEGVENEAQAAFLARAGCPWVQGYAFGRPLEPQRCALRLAGCVPAPEVV